MIHRYTINVQEYEQITVSDTKPPISFKGYKVFWCSNSQRKLEKIIMEISDRPIKLDNRGIVLSRYPELDAIVFNFASFLSNSIFIQTSIDPFDPFSILSSSPELIPQSPEEERMIKSSKITAHNSLDVKWKILGRFDPTPYVGNFKNSIAVAHFSEALRSNNPFQKFECYFKVIESLFEKKKNEKAKSFDLRISEYSIQFDKQFTVNIIKNLRQLRNRCVHPDNSSHLSPEDLESFYLIRAELKTIHKLARLLLDNPPNAT